MNLDYKKIRERAEWGDPADEWDHATVLELLDRVERHERELGDLRALAPSKEQRTRLGDDPEFFQPGHVYTSTNGWFRFTCEVVVAGVALGFEDCLKIPSAPRSRRIWMTVKPEGCWKEADAADTDSSRLGPDSAACDEHTKTKGEH